MTQTGKQGNRMGNYAFAVVESRGRGYVEWRSIPLTRPRSSGSGSSK